MKKIILFLALAMTLGSAECFSATPRHKTARKSSTTAVTATPALTSLPDGFDINTILGRESFGDYSYLVLNKNIGKSLLAYGFKHTGNTREKIFLSSEDDTPTSVAAKIYSQGGISITVAGTSDVCRISLKFPNSQTLNQFIDRAVKYGYDKRYTEGGTAIYMLEDSNIEMKVKGLKITFQPAS